MEKNIQKKRTAATPPDILGSTYVPLNCISVANLVSCKTEVVVTEVAQRYLIIRMTAIGAPLDSTRVGSPASLERLNSLVAKTISVQVPVIYLAMRTILSTSVMCASAPFPVHYAKDCALTLIIYMGSKLGHFIYAEKPTLVALCALRKEFAKLIRRHNLSKLYSPELMKISSIPSTPKWLNDCHV